MRDRRPLPALGAAAVLVLGYLALSLLNSPRGFLGTDTGGKVATLEVMTERGRFDPDLGYWAEEWDQSGALHPLAYTSHPASGAWVNVTTLPALWVGWQLYRVGGYRAALLVPMLGSVAAAFAARALLRRLRVGERAAWKGFWLFGLASPLTIYALDFWEHSLGVALMAWGVVLLVDVVDGAGAGVGGAWWRALAAGALFGAAATMRTEALIYVGLAGAALAGGLVLRRARLPRLAAAGALFVVGVAVPLVVNEAVERQVVGSTIRASRTAGTLLGAGTTAASRLQEGMIATFGLEGSTRGLVLGAALVALLVVGALRADLGVALTALAGAGALLVVRLATSGLGFVPGMLVAAPLGPAAALLLLRFGRAESEIAHSSRPMSSVGALAGVAVPLVVAFQPTGGAEPQWGGRYQLVSGFLLAAVGMALLERRPRPVRVAFAVLAVVVTGAGLAWVSVRTHSLARTMAALERRPEPVVVSGVYHLRREGGAFYPGKRWLTLGPAGGPVEAAGVLRAAGIDRFASVQLAGDRPLGFPGFDPVNSGELPLFAGVDLRVVSWRRGS